MLETKSNERDTLNQSQAETGVHDGKLDKKITITEKSIVKKEEVKVKGNNKKGAKKSKKARSSSAAKAKKASIAATKIAKEEKKDEGIEKYGRKLNKYDLTDFNTYLFHEGKNYEAYNIMGAHLTTEMRVKGVRFTTWAPKAKAVYVVGSFNNFEIREEYKLQKVTEHGIWSGFFNQPVENDLYKFCIVDQNGVRGEFKSDPYGVQSEVRPNNASRYKWNDKKWQAKQKKVNVFESPINIYEVHLGSWKRKDNGDFLTYEELSKELPKYVKDMGYTYVEIMPILEHPLDASWGYQGTGYYSPTTRYGKLEDVKKLIDAFHNEDIGVILDWVPGHFCKDANGLYRFDGTPTYEYQEEWRAENAGWGTCNFDLGRPEVKSYLISNALYWFREFHVDGLRVDAVSSILYLDYDRSDGQWVPNKYGGNGNLEGMQFLKDLNTAVLSEFPSGLMIAEESTAWPNICKPPKDDGLGFNFKWDMGWMNDVLEYVQVDPLYRRQFHKNITFSMMYNYSENFILPLSHDEVVHGKKSLLNKMWGDKWNKFAGVRVFATYMMAHPGKKLLFMGSEFAQFIEWREYEGLEWISMEDDECYKQTQVFFKDLNHLYKDNKAFWELDYDVNGFSWIDPENKDQSILVFMRKSRQKEDTLIFVINFKSEVYYDFTIGVPFLGEYEEVFNSDSTKYGGSGQIIGETLYSENKPFHNQQYSLKVKVPPMAGLVLKVKDIVDPNAKNKKDDEKLIGGE